MRLRNWWVCRKVKRRKGLCAGKEMRVARVLLLLASLAATSGLVAIEEDGGRGRGRVINLPESVIWVVQLSDLHLSVHNPERAIDLMNLVGPALSVIQPSLVLITGDLTDGKSKDLLTMKQNEDEWVEYQNVMDDVVKKSGLDKSIFYDLRGNHDNFGVPNVGASVDFFSKYSINGQLGRSGHVNSVTLQTGNWRYLFVGLDTTASVGLRGPTNLFGHPTDHLLTEIDLALSQWDLQMTKPVTKISFGHFPLSFSAASHSGKTLKDIFLKHSLSAYLCGHLHTRFGKNLKRYHQSSSSFLSSLQLNMHESSSGRSENCSFEAEPVKEFWEWEMGDWRKSRAMRILASDNGHVSYIDIDFKSEAKKNTIILPTFPLDSRFMSMSSSHHAFYCQHIIPSSYETARALVFSSTPTVSVVAKFYDSVSGSFQLVLEEPMRKHTGNNSRGDLYITQWNYRAFEDPSPDRFWMQIETTDIFGESSLSELRPFSVNGLSSKMSWTWKEFMVMGCQWADLYYPILWFALFLIFSILLIPKTLIVCLKNQYTCKKFIADKGFVNGIMWVLQELCRIFIVWLACVGYSLHLTLLPWFSGQVFTDGGERVYMTYKGWVINKGKNHEYVGSPDVMVIVIPHLVFVLLPAILVTAALAAERKICQEYFLMLRGKKEDDYMKGSIERLSYGYGGSRSSKFFFDERWIRKILLLICFAICWKHFKNCRALVKAYEMNPFLHCPGYSLFVPLMLAYVVYKTSSVK